jgi:molecular chaperone DnaK
MGTGKEQKVEIKAGSGLSDAEIKSMVADAEANADEDLRQRALAEARNVGEAAAYQAEHQLKDLGDNVDADSRSRIEAELELLQQAIAGSDTAGITAQTEALQTAFHALSQAMYARAQTSTGDAESEGYDSEADDEVIDAEVVA